jgi:hypothetical protein
VLLPSELIALAVFKERLRMLGLVAVRVDEGGSRAALFDRDGLRVRVEHSGYGGGCGGDRPVRVLATRIESPSYREGSPQALALVERVDALVRALLAPAPKVHDDHPEQLALALQRLFDEHGATVFRTVTFAPEHEPLLESDEPFAQRMLAYARVADAIGSPITVHRRSLSGPDAERLFHGTSAALVAVASDVCERCARGRYYVTVEGEADGLAVIGGLSVRRELVRDAAFAIARARQRRRRVWVELDATPVATLSLRGEHELAAVHHALDALLADCNAPAFGVRRSGQTAKTYKRDKLRALATALRAELAAGGVVCVEPAFEKLIPHRVRWAL